MGNVCGNRLLGFKEIAEIPHAGTRACAHTYTHAHKCNEQVLGQGMVTGEEILNTED